MRECPTYIFARIFGEGNSWLAFRTGCPGYALQQIFSLAVDQGDSESEAFLYEQLRNYQLIQNE